MNIEQRIGCLIGENIASNDVALHTILRYLHPNLLARDRVIRRLRPLGHIVNIYASALVSRQSYSDSRCRAANGSNTTALHVARRAEYQLSAQFMIAAC